MKNQNKIVFGLLSASFFLGLLFWRVQQRPPGLVLGDTVCELQAKGDIDCSGKVDLIDYGIWLANFGLEEEVTGEIDSDGDSVPQDTICVIDGDCGYLTTDCLEGYCDEGSSTCVTRDKTDGISCELDGLSGACASGDCCTGCLAASGECQTGDSETHCGSGGESCVLCVSGQQCVGGECSCGPNEAIETGSGLCTCVDETIKCSPNDFGCIDPNTDGDNCGSCGNECSVGEICSSGACIPEPPAP